MFARSLVAWRWSAWMWIAAVTASALCPAAAQRADKGPEQRFDPVQDIGIDQHLGARLPLQRTFIDESGRSVALGDFFGSRPVVVALVYYECPMLCTEVLNGMVHAFRGLSLELGRDYEVVTVSIDARETPAMARKKKDAYVASYAAPGSARGAAGDAESGSARARRAEAGWHFLTGSREAIDALAGAIGFRFVYDPKADEFAHAGGIVVATPEGELARYFYGIEYYSGDLRLGLVEASAGRIGGLVDAVLLLCYHYDPTTGRYGFAITNALRALGILTVVGMAAFVSRSLARERAAQRRQAREGRA